MFHILVVEDDTNTRKLTCDVLSDNGYTPIEARDGIEALEIMDEKHVDLIIMDVMMPYGRLGALRNYPQGWVSDAYINGDG